MLERKARLQLQQLIADGNTPQKIVKRARIILMSAAGHGVMAIMCEVGVSKTTVWRWQKYFAEAVAPNRLAGSQSARSDQTQGRREDRERAGARNASITSGSGKACHQVPFRMIDRTPSRRASRCGF